MVDAGIARKVDFGEGKFRFEHSYRHPRHFHLICKTCNRSFEFLSSDIKRCSRKWPPRNFTPRQSVLQIHGTCDACRTGRPAPSVDEGTTELLFARDALRIAIATERSGLEFYSRRLGSPAMRAAAGCSKSSREKRRSTSPRLNAYRSCCSRILSSSRVRRFSFFKGAANGLFAAGAEQLTKGVNDRQALMIGIRCERGSHKFFKRYGERFEDSEGRADLSRVRRRRTRAPGAADSRIQSTRAAAGIAARPQTGAQVAAGGQRVAFVIDLHLHTTASDGRLQPSNWSASRWLPG